MPWKIWSETGREFNRLSAIGAKLTVSQLWRQTMNDNEGTIVKLPVRRIPWNKGKLIGAKPPLRPSHVWSIRTKLQIDNRKRNLVTCSPQFGNRQQAARLRRCCHPRR
jgi:hypothetical protein